jgi:hypothetical protein
MRAFVYMGSWHSTGPEETEEDHTLIRGGDVILLLDYVEPDYTDTSYPTYTILLPNGAIRTINYHFVYRKDKFREICP